MERLLKRSWDIFMLIAIWAGIIVVGSSTIKYLFWL